MKSKLMVLLAVIIAVVIAGWRSYGDWAESIYDTNVSETSYVNTGEIQGNSVLTQEFFSEYNNLSGISLKISNLNQSIKSEFKYEITEKGSNEILAEGIIDTSAFTSEKFNIIKFDNAIANSKGKEYIIRIQDNNTNQGNGIAIYMTQAGDNGGELKFQDEASDNVLVMRTISTRFNLENFIVFIGLIMYIVLFIWVLNKFLK